MFGSASILVSRDSDQTRAKARSAAGRFTSSVSDVSAEHDKYLAEAIAQS
jgi:hypothetical protein